MSAMPTPPATPTPPSAPLGSSLRGRLAYVTGGLCLVSWAAGWDVTPLLLVLAVALAIPQSGDWILKKLPALSRHDSGGQSWPWPPALAITADVDRPVLKAVFGGSSGKLPASWKDVMVAVIMVAEELGKDRISEEVIVAEGRVRDLVAGSQFPHVEKRVWDLFRVYRSITLTQSNSDGSSLSVALANPRDLADKGLNLAWVHAVTPRGERGYAVTRLARR